jgi:glycosyltransferase involved in cell wall biosynthesis
VNVLMITPHFAPRLGGVEKHVLRVSEELTRLGHAVTVLTRLWKPGWPRDEDLIGIHVRRVPGGMAKAVCDRQLEVLNRAQVIHCHDLYSYLRFIAPAWPGPRPPLFVTFHGYEGYPLPRTARWLRRRLAARAAATICMGEFIPRWYGHRCDLVSYGGVDAPPARVPDPPPQAPALYVGRLAPDTGIMRYLETLRRLRERGHDLPLVICGDGPLRDTVLSAARRAGVSIAVQGWTREVGPFLEGCRIAFVSGYLTILEAMAYRRLACALYDNPLKRDYFELFPASSHMVTADEPDRLAAAIARHLEQPEASGAGLDAAEAFARAQTWARVAALYLDLYRGRGLPA